MYGQVEGGEGDEREASRKNRMALEASGLSEIGYHSQVAESGQFC